MLREWREDRQLMLLNQPHRRARLLTGQLCLIELVAWGVLYYTFSVFLSGMKTDLGWSSATLAAGFSLALFMSGASSPLVGAWIDRRGSRELMIGAAVIGSTGVVLWSLSQSLASYFGAWALIGIAMAGLLYAPAFATVVRFNPATSRNAILTITLVGALASTAFLPLASVLSELFGWRVALVVLAVVLGGVTLPLTYALPRQSKSLDTEKATDPEPPCANKAPASFWILTSALMLADAAGVALNAHMVVFLVTQGQATHAAPAIAGLTGLAKIGGRLATATGSRFSALSLLRWSLLIQAAVLAFPLLWPATWSLVVMVIGFGASSGARTVLRPSIVVEMYGATRFGTSNGLLQFYTTLSKSAGPVGLGVMVGLVGWSWSWLLIALVVAGSSVLLLGIRRKLPTARELGQFPCN